jgi:Zn-dependent protease with chaperone function
MDALPEDEFHAVLAHEFAHFSRAHGRTGNWLYRMRRSWENVAASLAGQEGLFVRPFGLFFNWFLPRSFRRPRPPMCHPSRKARPMLC